MRTTIIPATVLNHVFSRQVEKIPIGAAELQPVQPLPSEVRLNSITHLYIILI